MAVDGPKVTNVGKNEELACGTCEVDMLRGPHNLSNWIRESRHCSPSQLHVLCGVLWVASCKHRERQKSLAELLYVRDVSSLRTTRVDLAPPTVTELGFAQEVN